MCTKVVNLKNVRHNSNCRKKAIGLLAGKTKACKELIEFFVDNYWPGLDDEDNISLFESYLNEEAALKHI